MNETDVLNVLGDLMNGTGVLNVLIKETPQRFLVSSTM